MSIEYGPGFVEEAQVWRHMAVTSPEAIPRLYSAQTAGEFGVIVTDVGVPLTEIFTSFKTDHTHIAVERYEEFFQSFRTLDDFNASTSDLPVTDCDWNRESEDLDEVKRGIFESLRTSVLPGLERANVLHWDLELENLLYMSNSKRRVVCDFGVSLITSDETMRRGPRGALRYIDAKSSTMLCASHFQFNSVHPVQGPFTNHP